MLDPVAGEDDPPPVVHPHGDADDERALGKPEALRDLGRNLCDFDGLLELRDRHAVERCVPLERGLGKRFGSARHGAPSVSAKPITHWAGGQGRRVVSDLGVSST